MSVRRRLRLVATEVLESAPAAPPRGNDMTTNKTDSSTDASDDLQAEYDLDYARSRPNRFAPETRGTVKLPPQERVESPRGVKSDRSGDDNRRGPVRPVSGGAGSAG